MSFSKRYRVKPGEKVRLGRFRTRPKGHRGDEKTLASKLEKSKERLAELQYLLYAEGKRSLLICLQALDAAGKDGTITHVLNAMNSQGTHVHSFKAPSKEELSHDFLWRIAQKTPRKGEVAIFNRSHYEDVLVVRVHPEFLEGQKLPPSARGDDVWERRYRQINDWERILVENGFPVVKVFLNLSKEEQRRRFLRRIDFLEKNWKFNAHDVEERKHWDEYQTAFSQMLSATSTEHAPWYVVPADHKWFLRVAVAAVLLNTLIEIDPQYPTITDEARDALLASKKELEAQAPEGVEADPIAAAAAAAAKE
jgi:PPK2 family polyphosphate:nucleotide phosphotransferase